MGFRLWNTQYWGDKWQVMTLTELQVIKNVQCSPGCEVPVVGFGCAYLIRTIFHQDAGYPVPLGSPVVDVDGEPAAYTLILFVGFLSGTASLCFGVVFRQESLCIVKVNK